MGFGSYSVENSITRSALKGYDTKSTHEVFSQRSINSAMNPYNVKLRESRDSKEHPDSLAIVIGLDLTGSMGSIPHHLVKEGLTHIMEKIMGDGEPDPQVLFLGVGDHETDNSPLQVGQFESGDELLDKWLTDVYLEGGGGANEGESYLLAWYFAAMHTAIDCHEKRGRKGFLFTIGDEPTLKEIPKHTIQALMGDGQYENFSAAQLYDKAREKYDVYHIHVKETRAGSMQSTIDGWKQLLADNLLVAERKEDIPFIIAKTVLKKEDQTITKDDVGSIDEIML